MSGNGKTGLKGSGISATGGRRGKPADDRHELGNGSYYGRLNRQMTAADEPMLLRRVLRLRDVPATRKGSQLLPRAEILRETIKVAWFPLGCPQNRIFYFANKARIVERMRQKLVFVSEGAAFFVPVQQSKLIPRPVTIFPALVDAEHLHWHFKLRSFYMGAGFVSRLPRQTRRCVGKAVH